jgi:hypothetical protein
MKPGSVLFYVALVVCAAFVVTAEVRDGDYGLAVLFAAAAVTGAVGRRRHRRQQ